MMEKRILELLTKLNGDITIAQLQAQLKDEGATNLEIMCGVREWLYRKR